MVSLGSLWVPILLSAVLAFVASSIFHMLLPFHRTDFGKLPKEDELQEALRRFEIPPGDYMLPCPKGPNAMKSPEFLDKLEKGPVAVMTVMPSGDRGMGQALGLWFVYCVVVSVFGAYVAGRALGPGAPYLEVFRFVSTVAFVGYTLASWQSSIWYKRSWITTIKLTIDGLVYSLLAGGVFGWLWPR